MSIRSAIFTPASIKPLLAAWNQIGQSVAYNHPRSASGDTDVLGMFNALGNALMAMGNSNQELNAAHNVSKMKMAAHDDACIARVQEAYNSYLEDHNRRYHVNAIALGGLATCSPEKILVPADTWRQGDDPVQYALQQTLFKQQYWQSARGLLHFFREALELRDNHKMLTGVANTIENVHLGPLEKENNERWLTLLVLGGSAHDLQLAREKVAMPYIKGFQEVQVLLGTVSTTGSQNAVSQALLDAFSKGLTHPPSNPAESTGPGDLGL